MLSLSKHMHNIPKKGIYHHYKGNTYHVLGIAKHSETLEDLAVYKPLYKNPLVEYWVRPVDMFLEDVDVDGKTQKRFKYISAVPQESQRPKVGVAVIVIRDGTVLCGKRKNSHGHGHWGFPGGHLEYGESWEECARRENDEETGLVISNLRYGAATNDIFAEEHTHYITIFMLADYVSGEAQIKEPEKCDGWKWFTWEELPENVFLPIKNLLQQDFNPISLKITD